VVVLTGEGRAFCAGTDLVEMAAIATAMSEPGAEGYPENSAGKGFTVFLEQLTTFPKPLLAAVNGAGVGLGLTMLAHCDLVLVADTARLKAPFAEMGVAPEAASSYLLPVRMGAQAAALALYTSRWISADEAVSSGLALRSVPADQLLAEAQALAHEIAGMPLASLVATKRLLLDAHADAVQAARAREDAAFAVLLKDQGAAAAVLGQLDR
jgi:enoyl-CoA hydratase/carnithine racemase